MTKDELKTWLTEQLDSDSSIPHAFFRQDFPSPDNSMKYVDPEVAEFCYALDKAGIEHVEQQQHGGEGEGDDYYVVTSFTKDSETVYVKFQGWYQSYNGSEYTEWFFVEPKEVTVTQYFKVE